jgi:hypothetical protein
MAAWSPACFSHYVYKREMVGCGTDQECIGTPPTRGTVEHIARYQRYATTSRSPFRLSIGLGCSVLAGRVGAAHTYAGGLGVALSGQTCRVACADGHKSVACR